MKHDNPIKGMPGGSVSECIKQKKGHVRDPGAYCAAIADRIEPGWRKKSNPMKYRYERPFMRSTVILESDVRFETGAWPRGKIRVVAKPTNLTKDGAIKVLMKGLETGETKVSPVKEGNPARPAPYEAESSASHDIRLALAVLGGTGGRVKTTAGHHKQALNTVDAALKKLRAQIGKVPPHIQDSADSVRKIAKLPVPAVHLYFEIIRSPSSRIRITKRNEKWVEPLVATGLIRRATFGKSNYLAPAWRSFPSEVTKLKNRLMR